MQYRYKESNLSPPVLAKNKGTVVFRLVPLQGEVSGSVLDFISILHGRASLSFSQTFTASPFLTAPAYCTKIFLCC